MFWNTRKKMHQNPSPSYIILFIFIKKSCLRVKIVKYNFKCPLKTLKKCSKIILQNYLKTENCKKKCKKNFLILIEEYTKRISDGTNIAYQVLKKKKNAKCN